MHPSNLTDDFDLAAAAAFAAPTVRTVMLSFFKSAGDGSPHAKSKAETVMSLPETIVRMWWVILIRFSGSCG
jgi:hypothetical protein